ncbi:hypothetical protein M5D96_007681 [Drosophila gunungcola]|uniref:histone acetyltransferase n=1 Tax=Drosophila gunungcola TaxID=103775 RepID=A0A9P9YLC2_9MUSC|nr:hypothetical protein M5D96_007681 [Drosophila gunungcola]
MVNGISHAFEDCFRRARIASIQAQSIHVPHFIEAIQCSFDNCILTKCNRMKRYIRHYKQCRLRRTGRCQACRNLIIIKCSHVLNCKEKQCSFPDCSELKQKIKKYLD